MLRLDRILLASDFSASAEAALQYAAVLAGQTYFAQQRFLPRWRLRIGQLCSVC